MSISIDIMLHDFLVNLIGLNHKDRFRILLQSTKTKIYLKCPIYKTNNNYLLYKDIFRILYDAGLFENL